MIEQEEKKFSEYVNAIKQNSKLCVNDCKMMQKLHHFELIGVIAAAVAQYELRIFNHFCKINNIISGPHMFGASLRIPHVVIYKDKFEELEEIENYKIRRIQSGEIIDVKKLAEILQKNPKTLTQELLNDRWNKDITKIIDLVAKNGELDWFKRAREIRHQLIHSPEKESGNYFDAVSSTNKTKQKKTIFDALAIMELAFGIDNFSLDSLNFKKPFHFPPNLDESLPCHLTRYIEENKWVFGFVANYNELSKENEMKFLISWVTGKNDVQYFGYSQNKAFMESMNFNGVTIFYSFEKLKNKEFFSESIYSQAVSVDGRKLHECGVDVIVNKKTDF